MTLELRVPGRIQTTPMSCWWASIAMVLEYYGSFYHFPYDYKIDFQKPYSRPRISSLPDMHLPSLDEAMAYSPDLSRTNDLAYLQPYEWYWHGLPATREAFQRLADITGFRGFDRPAFGSWSARDISSRLRRYGPFVFFGFWNGAPHSIVVVGLIEEEGRTVVVTIDPIRGFPTSEPLASFNTRMRRIMTDLNGLNPFYFPVENPVRAIVHH